MVGTVTLVHELVCVGLPRLGATLLLLMQVLTLATPLAAQDAASIAKLPATTSNEDAVTKSEFFSTEGLDEATRRLSEDLLLKAMDGEAFYTLVGQLKPVSEGFWGGYFPVDTAELEEIERVRSALRSWCMPGMYYADVLVYLLKPNMERYASAYVVHVPSLRRVVDRERAFFGRWGITVDTPPSEIMLTIERARQPDERWRGFGWFLDIPTMPSISLLRPACISGQMGSSSSGISGKLQHSQGVPDALSMLYLSLVLCVRKISFCNVGQRCFYRNTDAYDQNTLGPKRIQLACSRIGWMMEMANAIRST